MGMNSAQGRRQRVERLEPEGGGGEDGFNMSLDGPLHLWQEGLSAHGSPRANGNFTDDLGPYLLITLLRS